MFQYSTEILLLTRSIHPEELYCWLIWHLNILHFDHVVLFDNESPIDVNSVISKFPKEKIEYYYIKGWPNQYKLYNEYLKSPKAQWTIALDDDEYLYLSDLYNSNIHSFIESLTESYKDTNKFYILWTNMFSKEPIEEYSELFINTHTYYSYDACRLIKGVWPEDNGWGKTLINNNFSYIYTSEKNLGHIPTCVNGNDKNILVRNGAEINSAHLNTFIINNLYPHAFIAHYQYKNKKDWKLKCNTQIATHPTFTIKNKINVYSNLYDHKSLFQSCTLLKERLDDYIADK